MKNDPLQNEKVRLKVSGAPGSANGESLASDSIVDEATESRLPAENMTRTIDEKECLPPHSDSESFPVIDEGFQILDCVGSGGMSTVYKAINKQTGSVVAIKVLSAALTKDKSALKRFELESQSLVDLNDPEMLTMYGSGLTESGSPYLVMEFIDGDNLSEVIERDKKLDEKRALSLFIKLASLLSHAHKRGIVHRDIKPSNIILTNLADADGQTNSESIDSALTEQVRIVDFGIARIVESATGNTTSLTQTGAIFGTPTYMSPEQCHAAQDVDHRSDIYSLGCVMYEVLTGKPPFHGDNPIQVAMQHLNNSAPEFPGKSKDLLKSLEAIVLKCLEKDRDERYQSVDDLLKDLNRVSNGKTVRGKKRPKPKNTKSIQVHWHDGIPLSILAWSLLTLLPLNKGFLSFSQIPTESDGVCWVFILLNLLGIIKIPMFAWKQYRIIRRDGASVYDHWGFILTLVSVLVLYSGLISFGLGLFHMPQDNTLFVFLSSVFAIMFAIAAAVFFCTLAVGCVVVTVAKVVGCFNTKVDKPVSMRVGLIQFCICSVVCLVTLAISCVAAPRSVSWLTYSLAVFTASSNTPNVTRALCEAALTLDPSNIDASVGAIACNRKGDPAANLSIVDAGIKASPANVTLLLARAKIYGDLKTPEKGIQDVNQAVKLLRSIPKEERILESSLETCIALRGNLHAQMGQFPEAINDYSEAIAENPRDSTLYRNRGALYAATKDYARSLDDLNSALIAGFDHLDYLRLATVYNLKGDTQQAKNSYRKGLESFYEDTLAKAFAYKKLNEQEQYQKQVEEFEMAGKKKTPQVDKEFCDKLFDSYLHIPVSW